MTPAELRALLAKATPGPFEIEVFGGVVAGDRRVARGTTTADARLFVAVVNALPAFVELWEAAQTAVDVNEITAGLVAALAKLATP